MTRDEIRERCCIGDTQREQQREAVEIAAGWFEMNPPPVGCSPDALRAYQKKCHRYVVATMRQRQTAAGFGFDPGSIWLIWQIVSALWTMWQMWKWGSDDE